MTKAAIRIENLDFSYGGSLLALKNVNLRIDKNEFVAIIGRNGSGKSTLLKNITGLFKPLNGNAYVLGANTKEVAVAKLATKVGFVLQNPDRQLFSATVYDEVAFGPKNLGLPRDEVAKRVEAALEEVDLVKERDSFPPALSRGDRAKVVLASVLAMNPEIIILDEPTSGQDYRGSYQIMNLARGLHDRGLTIIIVTHNMALVAEYAKRVIVFCDGRVITDGSVRSVFSRPEVLLETNILLPQVSRLGLEFRDELGLQEAVLSVEELGDSILRRMGL